MKQSFNHKPCLFVRVLCGAWTVLLLALAVPAVAQQEAKFMLEDFQSAKVYFPSHEAEIEAFSDKHKIRMSNVGDALRLIDYSLSLK